MERKGSISVVTSETVTKALKKTSATGTEEKALRMRYGATTDLSAPLPSAHGDNEELGDELLLLEMRLLSALKRHQGLSKAKAPVVKNATKSKIVVALKSKKK